MPSFLLLVVLFCFYWYCDRCWCCCFCHYLPQGLLSFFMMVLPLLLCFLLLLLILLVVLSVMVSCGLLEYLFNVVCTKAAVVRRVIGAVLLVLLLQLLQFVLFLLLVVLLLLVQVWCSIVVSSVGVLIACGGVGVVLVLSTFVFKAQQIKMHPSAR